MTELCHLHCRLRHPDKLMQLLRKSNYENMIEDTHHVLKKISLSCPASQMFSVRSQHFNFTLQDDSQFNSTI